MNILILDAETEIVLYGHILLDVMIKTQRSAEIKEYRIPAEAWLAYLGHVHYEHPEVQAYVNAVTAGEGINPQEGKLLRAVDEVIDLSEQEADRLYAWVQEHENDVE